MDQYYGGFVPELKKVVKKALSTGRTTYTDVADAMKQMKEKEPENVR